MYGFLKIKGSLLWFSMRMIIVVLVYIGFPQFMGNTVLRARRLRVQQEC